MDSIVNTPELRAAAAATREALARGGVATVDSGGVRTPVTEPAASATATPLEIANLALEARRRATAGRMTASRLGSMLQDFGWPVAAGANAGEQMIDFLGVWVTEARKAPEDPRNFAPLFLAAMAERQVPGIDLSTGTADPSDVRFTLLELEILAAAFDRVMTPPDTMPPDTTHPDTPRPDTVSFGRRTPVAAFDPGPCSQFKKRLGTFGDVGSVVADEALSEALSKTLEVMHGEDGAVVGHLFDALATAARIWKLIAFYASGEVRVTLLSDNPLHKQAPSEAHQLAGFEASAGVSAEDYRQYLEEVGATAAEDRAATIDCFNVLGISNFGDPTQIARDAENWKVEWRILNEDGSTHDSKEHVYLLRGNNDSLFSNGHLRQQMERQDATTARALLVANLTDEKGVGHLGHIESARLTTRAEVIASGVPDLSTLVTAATGVLGIIESLVELAAGWIQEALPPKAYAEFTVEYHVEDGRRYQLLMTNKWEETTVDRFGKPVHQTGEEAYTRTMMVPQANDSSYFVGEAGFTATYTRDMTLGEKRCHDKWGGTRPARVSFMGAVSKPKGKKQITSLVILPAGPSTVFGRIICGTQPPPSELETRGPIVHGLDLPTPAEGNTVVELPATPFNRWTIEIQAMK